MGFNCLAGKFFQFSAFARFYLDAVALEHEVFKGLRFLVGRDQERERRGGGPAEDPAYLFGQLAAPGES